MKDRLGRDVRPGDEVRARSGWREIVKLERGGTDLVVGLDDAGVRFDLDLVETRAKEATP